MFFMKFVDSCHYLTAVIIDGILYYGLSDWYKCLRIRNSAYKYGLPVKDFFTEFQQIPFCYDDSLLTVEKIREIPEFESILNWISECLEESLKVVHGDLHDLLNNRSETNICTPVLRVDKVKGDCNLKIIFDILKLFGLSKNDNKLFQNEEGLKILEECNFILDKEMQIEFDEKLFEDLNSYLKNASQIEIDENSLDLKNESQMLEELNSYLKNASQIEIDENTLDLKNESPNARRYIKKN
ncbi:hypothetical protein AVEN_162354-1 [Araneus ventricosus]|uniref:Uncharacterized protein n=1 Tax=Araneus ventricosus TaxID=182803 RepID=A0A4Y2N469_ARAVE|nr:hypothetical protein AVEN_162354-1 [Araneus ventricosus]